MNNSWNLSPLSGINEEETKDCTNARITSLEEELKEYRVKLEYYQSRPSREEELSIKQQAILEKEGRIIELEKQLTEAREKIEAA